MSLKNKLRLLYISNEFFIKKQKDSTQAQKEISEIEKIFFFGYMNRVIGFFITSIKSIADCSLFFGTDGIHKHLSTNWYDIIVIDSKIIYYLKLNKDTEHLIKYKCKKILIDYHDTQKIEPLILKLEKLFSFNAIFMTNMLKDKSHYEFPKNILTKIYPTFVGTGFLDVKYNFRKDNFENINNKNYTKKYDLFFIGKFGGHRILRNQIIKEISTHKLFKKYNMLIMNTADLPGGENLHPNKYIKFMKRSNICLDLTGNHGSKGFRLFEALIFGELPILDWGFKRLYESKFFEPLINDFCFNSIDEFFEYVELYKDKNLRNTKIIDMRRLLLDFYNPRKHGEFIKKTIF